MIIEFSQISNIHLGLHLRSWLSWSQILFVSWFWMISCPIEQAECAKSLCCIPISLLLCLLNFYGDFCCVIQLGKRSVLLLLSLISKYASGFFSSTLGDQKGSDLILNWKSTYLSLILPYPIDEFIKSFLLAEVLHACKSKGNYIENFWYWESLPSFTLRWLLV